MSAFRTHAPAPIAGFATFSKGGAGNIAAVSCPAAGKCTAGGRYATASGHALPFLVSRS